MNKKIIYIKYLINQILLILKLILFIYFMIKYIIFITSAICYFTIPKQHKPVHKLEITEFYDYNNYYDDLDDDFDHSKAIYTYTKRKHYYNSPYHEI